MPQSSTLTVYLLDDLEDSVDMEAMARYFSSTRIAAGREEYFLIVFYFSLFYVAWLRMP